MNKVKEIFSSKSDETTTTDPSYGSTGSERLAGAGAKSTTAGARDPAAARDIGTTGTSTTGAHGATKGDVLDTATRGGRVDDSNASAATAASGRSSLGGHEHKLGQHAGIDGQNTSHDHKHLAAVNKEQHHHHETEEVIREREHDRHIHHVQHHVQPVQDTVHKDHEHHHNTHEQSHIHESHTNTDEDRATFAALNVHQHEKHHAPKERQVIDRGEQVNENLHHHVHHVVQPVVERDVHAHHTIHTTIPVKHTTHEAPIIHQSSTHEPLQMKDFLAQGGKLDSKLTHDKAGVLANGECERETRGPLEKVTEKLGLASSHGSSSAAGTGGATAGTHGTTTTGASQAATTGAGRTTGNAY